MGTSTARELTCDRPASYPGGVMYSHPLALRKPGISTGLMSLKAREGFNLIKIVAENWNTTEFVSFVHLCIGINFLLCRLCLAAIALRESLFLLNLLVDQCFFISWRRWDMVKGFSLPHQFSIGQAEWKFMYFYVIINQSTSFSSITIQVNNFAHHRNISSSCIDNGS